MRLIHYSINKNWKYIIIVSAVTVIFIKKFDYNIQF